jgi:hypothetical protein
VLAHVLQSAREQMARDLRRGVPRAAAHPLDWRSLPCNFRRAGGRDLYPLALGAAVAPASPRWRHAETRRALFVVAAIWRRNLLLSLTRACRAVEAHSSASVIAFFFDAAIASDAPPRGTKSLEDAVRLGFIPRTMLPPFACCRPHRHALLWRGRFRHPFRAVTVLVLALGVFVPCLTVTFLWNRLCVTCGRSGAGVVRRPHASRARSWASRATPHRAARRGALSCRPR